MSTNLEMLDRDRHEVRHLGQRAGGWQFLFRAWPEIGVVDTQSWLRQLDAAEWIKDEYGSLYTVDEFLEQVEACEKGRPRDVYPHHWIDRGNVFADVEFS